MSTSILIGNIVISLFVAAFVLLAIHLMFWRWFASKASGYRVTERSEFAFISESNPKGLLYYPQWRFPFTPFWFDFMDDYGGYCYNTLDLARKHINRQIASNRHDESSKVVWAITKQKNGMNEDVFTPYIYTPPETK